MDEVFSTGPDLTDQPLKDPDAECFTDSSSFVEEGEHLSGYSVVTLNSTIETKTSAKRNLSTAELIVLTYALLLATRIRANIYTDSKYAFTTLHVMELCMKKRA